MKIDAIKQPIDAVRGCREKLLDFYCEDYGRDSRIALRKRMDNIYYCFESDPITTFKFYEEYGYVHISKKDQKRIELEAKEYERIKKEIHEKFCLSYEGLLLDVFYYNNRILSTNIQKMDFACMGTTAQKKLDDPQVSHIEKEKIKRRQRKFKNKVDEFGFIFRKEPFLMDVLVSEKANLQMKETDYLLKNTAWGKRIKSEFWQNGVAISDQKLCELFSPTNDTVANTWSVENKPIIYLPLMQRLDFGRLDEVFLHENRHAVETNGNLCGLTNFDDDRYVSINEVRVEKHALHDLAHINDIFQNDISLDQNLSECFFWYPFVKEFFDSEESLLDLLAVDSDVSTLEKIYSPESLLELDQFLNYIADYRGEESFASEKERERGKALSKNLIEQRNGVISR